MQQQGFSINPQMSASSKHTGQFSPDMPLAQETLDAQQEAAQAARENAELEEIRVLVAREENKWLKYKSDVAGWTCSNIAQRSAFKDGGSGMWQSLSRR